MNSNEIAIDLSSYLQSLMIKSGFEVAESAIDNPTFLKFMHLALVSSAEKLHQLKEGISQQLTGEESELSKSLEDIAKPGDIGSKLKKAVGDFEGSLISYLSNIMINSGYQVSETEESNSCYINFFTYFFTSETKKFITSKSNLKSKKVKSDNSDITEVVEYEDLKISDSSFKLLRRTEKHCLYRASTPNGDKVLKALRSKSPRSQEINNLVNELTMANKVEHHAFRQSFARTTYRSRHAILLEWIDGHSIGDLSEATAFGVVDFFAIGRDLVSAMMAIHEKLNVHINLTSEHISICN